MKRTTVTSSTTGQSITMPAAFVEGLSQDFLDDLVSNAHSPHPLPEVPAGVVRGMHVEKA